MPINIKMIIGRPVNLNEPSQCETLSNQKGQATLELILGIVVIILVMSGLFYQMHTGFKNYVDSFFGSYVRCLLETGELPGLASGDGVCVDFYPSFNVADGAKSSTGNRFAGGGTPRGENGAANGGRNRNREQAGRNGGGGSGRERMRTSSRSGNGEGRGGAGSSGFGNGRPSQISVKGNAGKAKSTSSKSSYNLSAASTDADDSNLRKNGRPKKIEVSEKFVSGSAKSADKDRPKNAKTQMSDRDRELAGRRPSTMSYRKPAAKQETPPNADTEMTFSGLLKWLLIIGIILGIVIFVGGQALQIAKSRGT